MSMLNNKCFTIINNLEHNAKINVDEKRVDNSWEPLTYLIIWKEMRSISMRKIIIDTSVKY